MYMYWRRLMAWQAPSSDFAGAQKKSVLVELEIHGFP